MLEEYDARWPEIFERTAIELAQVEPSWIVEHIGSTAIPGMAAKPVIDIAVRVGSHLEVQDRFDTLATHGWLRIARGPKTHLVLVKQQGLQRTHIAHFFTTEQWASCNQRLFRDWLLTGTNRQVGPPATSRDRRRGLRPVSMARAASVRSLLTSGRSARTFMEPIPWNRFHELVPRQETSGHGCGEEAVSASGDHP